MNLIRTSLFIFLGCILSLNSFAQAEKKKKYNTEQIERAKALGIDLEEDVKEEKLTAEERRAKIEEERKAADNRKKNYNKYQNQVNRNNDEQMFKYVGMNDKQIEKYNAHIATYKAETTKAMQSAKKDAAKMNEAMVSIRDKKTAGLKSIFTPEQLEKYMEFKEMKASKNRRSKNNNVVKTIN